jgi:hypothetical protein
MRGTKPNKLALLSRNIFDRYDIVSEADLLLTAERVQTHLPAQPKESVVVHVKAVDNDKADRRRQFACEGKLRYF